MYFCLFFQAVIEDVMFNNVVENAVWVNIFFYINFLKIKEIDLCFICNKLNFLFSLFARFDFLMLFYSLYHKSLEILFLYFLNREFKKINFLLQTLWKTCHPLMKMHHLAYFLTYIPH